MSNTRRISIYGLNYNDKIDCYFTERKLFLSLSLKLLQKRHFYNINKDFSAFGVVLKNSNYENITNLSTLALYRFFYKNHIEIDTDEFSLKLGETIITKTLAGEDTNLIDFEIKMWGGKYIFSTIENDNKTHTMFVFFPKDEDANARISKRYDDYTKSNLLEFVEYVEVDTYEKYISNELDTKLLLSLHKDLLKNFMSEYNTTSYNNVQYIDYDEVRLAPNYVSAVLKIAEYLGHGSYMKDMSKADKESISKYVVDGGSKKYEMFYPLRLKGKSVFYTGKGTATDDEKLIILS